jgi:hypothetical protein
MAAVLLVLFVFGWLRPAGFMPIIIAYFPKAAAINAVYGKEQSFLKNVNSWKYKELFKNNL